MLMKAAPVLPTACSSFAITNIDDIFVLATFFAEASTSATLTPIKITIGQYVGFTIIVAVSMIGFAVSMVLPSEPIGFLGLLPMLLGVWKLIELVLPVEENEEEEPDQSNISGAKSILKVSLITIMNGGDNIGTYIPLFSQAKGAEIAVYVVVYYILLGLWCLVAYLIMKQKHVVRLAQKYADLVVPFLFIGLGIYITVKSSCYPWSIEHIDAAHTTPSGKTIMAIVTTLVLLVIIGAMLSIRLRKRAVRSASIVGESNSRSAEAGSTTTPNLAEEGKALANSHPTEELGEEPGRDQKGYGTMGA
ncbi:hypothetical protein N7528_007987 [Penicillium herquei]|nr:hypothetical protein N7528_007987 [Penicillium herquei]